jgi:hypothetical protein
MLHFQQPVQDSVLRLGVQAAVGQSRSRGFGGHGFEFDQAVMGRRGDALKSVPSLRTGIHMTGALSHYIEEHDPNRTLDFHHFRHAFKVVGEG